MNVAVMVYGDTWTVVESEQEVGQVIGGMRHLNRWWRDHSGEVRTTLTLQPVTDPLLRPWYVVWEPGRAGWDCMPLVPPCTEMVKRNSGGVQHAVVTAPSAHLAIERAKLLCLEGGKA